MLKPELDQGIHRYEQQRVRDHHGALHPSQKDHVLIIFSH